MVMDVQKTVRSINDGDAATAVSVAPGLAAAASGAGEASQAPCGGPARKEISAESIIANDDQALAQDFISEATTHLESAEAALLVIEESPDDIEAINSTFRSFHTIKGVAGFLNLKQIGALAHASENLLDMARHGQLKIVGQVADVILESLDLMKVLIGSLREALSAGTVAPINDRLPGLLVRLDAAAAGKQPPATESSKSPAHSTTPSQAAEAGPASSEASSLKGREGSGEAAAPPGAPSDEPAAPPAASAEFQKVASAAKSNAEATVKVATDRLDSLINAVGELVIAQSMVNQDIAAASRTNPKLGRNLAHMGKITRELQDLSMSMRMVPIQGVFQKMARLVRDLAKKAGKEIDFVTEGAETELDRNLVEAISDPLVHMIRNAADHGIEAPEARVKAGKAPAGRIQLKAFHQGGSIAIQISDNGKGLPKARIVQKAIDAGIVTPGQELAEADIFKLIFHPGLSTAEKITDVSGRGVGMDVVKRNVESLRGRIDITSVEGSGSTFTIRLPLTLAVIDGLVIKVGAQRYILPITSVEQTIQPTLDQLSTIQNRGEMCLVRGKLLPLYRLHKIFNIELRSDDATNSLVLILHDNERRCCLLVDELIGQQQVVIKSVSETLGVVAGVSGAAILGDGSACLILDVAGLMDLAVAGE